MILEKIIEEAKKQNLNTLISGTGFESKIFDRRETLQENKKNPYSNYGDQFMQIQLPLNASNEAVQKIKNIIQNYKQKNKSNVQYEISQGLSVGKKLPNFGQIKKVFQEGTTELSAKQGQILLIDVWATWCGPCQKPMAHNKQMLQKNSWGEKVKIVGVSVDQDLEALKNRIQTKGWKDKIQHLTLQKWDEEHSLIKSFNINGIPFVCLVDGFGYIVYIGHPSSINIQNKINELLQQNGSGQIMKMTDQNDQQNDSENDSENQQQSWLKQLSPDEIYKLKQSVLNKQFLDNYFAKLDFYSVKTKLKCKANEGKTKNFASVQIYLKKEDKNIAQQFQKLLSTFNVNLKLNIVQTQIVPPIPKQCIECKCELKYPLYWCFWAKTGSWENWGQSVVQFRCPSCVEKKIDDTHFSYKQNSILLTNPVKQITKVGMGKNIQPNRPIQQLQPHSFQCNGCGQSEFKIGDARYVCLGCRSHPNHQDNGYVDLCQVCIKKYIEKDPSTIQALQKDNHKQNHPFLRILYNVNDYYEF